MLTRTHAAFLCTINTGHADADDELSWGRRELWWLPRAEVAESRLPIAALERELGPATLRSHRSVAGPAARHLVS